jgi:ubiquinone/menaquinone biosynthesis C-methylase UbiE
MQRAKQIILTSEGPGADTDTRWAIETPYVMELMGGTIGLQPDSIILDYGCGIGRMAKAMMEASGCSVIGIDISADMRRLAPDYVRSDRFVALSPAEFDVLVRGGLRVHAAIAVWVLQHCFKPAEDIARIRRALAPTGTLSVLNMPKRAVPVLFDADTKFAWAHDGVDVATILRAEFACHAEGVPDKSRTPNMADVGAYWMALRQRAA